MIPCITLDLFRFTSQYMKFGKVDVLKSHGVPEAYGISSACLKVIFIYRSRGCAPEAFLRRGGGAST